LTRGGVYFYALAANYTTGVGSLSPEVFRQVPYAQANLAREMEPNNTTSSATPINIGGGTIRGQMSSGPTTCSSLGDTDYYAFTSNGGVVNFTINVDTTTVGYGSNWIVAKIIAKDGSTIMSSVEINDDTKAPAVVLKANTLPELYYLVITPYFIMSGCPNNFQWRTTFFRDYIITPDYSY